VLSLGAPAGALLDIGSGNAFVLEDARAAGFTSATRVEPGDFRRA